MGGEQWRVEQPTVLVEGIIDWGVDVVFGLPGDGINGIMEALRTRQDRAAKVAVLQHGGHILPLIESDAAGV